MCLRNDESMHTFTGVNSVAQFKDLLRVLQTLAINMRYWSGESRTKASESTLEHKKPVPARNLDVQSEFILTLMKLRLGMPSPVYCKYV